MEFSPCWAKTKSLREEGALEGGKLCHEQKSDCREILSLVAAQLSSYFVFAPVGRKLHHIYYLLVIICLAHTRKAHLVAGGPFELV